MKRFYRKLKNHDGQGRSVRRTAVIIVAVMMLFLLAGCGKYVSHYKALLFVHSNEKESAYMTFHSFEGDMVFRLKSSGEKEIRYSGQLESGNAVIYYDQNGTKTELFSLSGGDETESLGGHVKEGTVYIIVETDGKCVNGDIRFSLE